MRNFIVGPGVSEMEGMFFQVLFFFLFRVFFFSSLLFLSTAYKIGFSSCLLAFVTAFVLGGGVAPSPNPFPLSFVL